MNIQHFVLLTLLFVLSISYSFSQKIVGTVYDEFGPLMEADVKIEGTDKGVLTDMDGKFSFNVPANQAVNIVISYTFYSDYKIENIKLKPGETKTFEVSMAIAVEGGKEIVIDAKIDEGKTTVILDQKAKSAKTFDGITSQEIQQKGDNNASQVVRRISGVSIEAGKYVYVRGLGDRYTKTILNGLDIPGLDPDKNSIQLDIFPSNIIKNIKVYKSFSPDLPGDFTGGLVDIATQDFPDEKMINASIGFGYNPGMNFNPEYVKYNGGSLDFLGFDDGTRRLPISKFTIIPDEAVADQQLTLITRLFSPTMAAHESRSLMNFNMALSGGNKYKIKLGKEDATFGFNTSFSYRNTTTFYQNAQFGRYTKDPDKDITELFLQEDRSGRLGQNNVIWSALASAGLKFNHAKYNLTLLRSQNGFSQTADRIRSNYDQTGATLFEDILTYTQRSVNNATLTSKWNFKKFELEALNSLTYSTISDPDFRTTSFSLGVNNDTLMALGDGAGISRFFRDLKEINNHSKLDFTIPFMVKENKSLLKFGASGILKSRSFDVQSFQFRVSGQTVFNGDPDYLFLPENIWNPETGNGTYAIGNYEPVNTYDATQRILAGYLMNELPIGKFRAVYGLRVENNVMTYDGQNNDGSLILNDTTTLNALNALPSMNLIYAIKNVVNDSSYSKMNLRASYNHTLARPSFKEKSIAQIFDPVSSRTFIGNIDLQQTEIVNYDLRWEYFFARGELISVSGFYKQFSGHIELVPFETAPDNLKPRNSGQSSVTGVEFEIRKTLGFISEKLLDWGVGLNATWVESKMDMNTVIVSNASQSQDVQTELQSRRANARSGEVIDQFRPMTGQSPYMINASINYGNKNNGLDANLSYNVQGKTLTIVGVGIVPDIYAQPFNSLNFKISKRINDWAVVSFRATNLLGDKRELVYESYGVDSSTDPAYFSLLIPNRTFSVKMGINLAKIKKNKSEESIVE